MNYVFDHPSKHDENDRFEHYEKIGDSYISNIIVNLIFTEYGPGNDLNDDIKQACISNNSLCVSSLLKGYQHKLSCLEPLTVGMLADTYEASIGEINHQLFTNSNEKENKELLNEVKKFVYDANNSEELDHIYELYKERANKCAKENGVDPLILESHKKSTSDIYSVNLHVLNTIYSGINRNHKKANLICYLSFLEDFKVSLK